MDVVKKYLVQGKGELVTAQEFMYFANICRARKLNPLTKDCYLIKYGSDPAAIVTSVDFYRKRARIQKDCRGWKKGCIVMGKDGVRDSFGLVQDDETLLGGWFEATPEGWNVPFRLEVNLKGYVKKTNEGKETKFWNKENQPSMIAKVAEAQGLRTLWPDQFQGIYTEDEIQDRVVDIHPVEDEKTVELFEKSIPAGTDISLLETFIANAAKQFKSTVENVKLEAVKDPKFWKSFDAFVKKQPKEPPKEQPKEQPKEMAPGPCPNNETETYSVEHCNQCTSRPGCPAFGE
jgi:phage recombination protein Bet